MGGAAKTVGRVGSGVLTLGASEVARNNLPRNNIIRNALGVPGTVLTGGLAGQDQMPAVFGGGNPNPYVGGPFGLDPAQMAADKAAITGLGDQQFGETNAFNESDKLQRATARQQLADALTKQSQAYFQQGLPATEETLNAQHLLNGSGLGQELARQQGNLATNIANQVGVQGANDINRYSDIGLGALQAKQGMGQSALSRGFSLEDFINQANVAKAIGAQAAPQVGNGKGQTGTLLSGVGSVLSPTASMIGKAAKANAGQKPYNWHDAQSDPVTGLG